MAQMVPGNHLDIRYQPKNRQGGRGAVSDSPPQYMPAKWKGVEFYCESSTEEFGRRFDLYEYPLSDRVALKDMGKKAIRFKVEGYLIGAAQLQINLSRDMAKKAQDPDPGYLEHPLHGRRRVICATLTMSADYKKDKKRTKLSFEFVEANPSTGAAEGGGTADNVFSAGSNAVQSSVASAQYTPADFSSLVNTGISDKLGSLISAPAGDEFALDAQDTLNSKSIMSGPQASVIAMNPNPIAPVMLARAAGFEGFTTSYTSARYTSAAYMSFARLVARIDYGAATVRRLYTDALEKLRDFNAFVVQQSERDFKPSVQSLVIATRLIIAREMAVVMMRKKYDTVKAALDDLDLIVAIYDEEEEAATRRCDDVLVSAIRHARAVTIEVILMNNVRLPGIVEFPTGGLWPSLVVAQKAYADGLRFEQIENYNPTMIPFWMGRDVITPAR